MDSPSTSATQSADEDDENIIQYDNDLKSHLDINLNPSNSSQASICKSSTGTCVLLALNGFEYCHKHILEDDKNPHQQCSFLSKIDMSRCCNPSQDEKSSLCVAHLLAFEKRKERNLKRRKKRKLGQQQKVQQKQHCISTDVSLKSFSVSKDKTLKALSESSSDEEEISFYTDSTKVEKIDCLWLGNQASDAESTDSDDEGLLNHAGVWTLEECVQICRDKILRLRALYVQQFKRIQYILKEERRKMLMAYDIDPHVLSKVGFAKVYDDSEKDYKLDMYLQNYQQVTGPALLCEKLMKEKRLKGTTLSSRRPELPRCQMSVNNQRCIKKVLPFSKYCYDHILNDSDQYLYISCINQKNKCLNPVEGFLKKIACRNHNVMLSNAMDQAWHNYKLIKKTYRKKSKRKDNRFKVLTSKKRHPGRKKENQKSDDGPKVAKSGSSITLKSPPIELFSDLLMQCTTKDDISNETIKQDSSVSCSQILSSENYISAENKVLNFSEPVSESKIDSSTKDHLINQTC